MRGFSSSLFGTGAGAPPFASGGARDKRFSVDSFLLASGLGTGDGNGSSSSNRAFVAATDSVWRHYVEGVAQRCERQDRLQDRLLAARGADTAEQHGRGPGREQEALWEALEGVVQGLLRDPLAGCCPGPQLLRAQFRPPRVLAAADDAAAASSSNS